MSDGITINPSTGVSEAVSVAFDDAGASGKVQVVKLAVSADGSAVVLPSDATYGLDVDVTRLPGTVAADITTVAGKDFATQTTLAALLAKLTADQATQTTLAAVLAKVSADPATQTTLAALQTGEAAVLAKLTSDPSTASAQTSQSTKLDTLHTDLAAVLAKIITAPATEATLATTNTNLGADGASPPAITGTGIRGWLRAIYEKVNGTLSVSGPLTDTQLRVSAPTVDLAVSVPLAITDAATATALRYVGVSVAETAGALAKVRVRNATVAGVILDTITLQANESVSYTYPRGRSAASGIIYVQVVSGTVEGSVFTV